MTKPLAVSVFLGAAMIVLAVLFVLWTGNAPQHRVDLTPETNKVLPA